MFSFSSGMSTFCKFLIGNKNEPKGMFLAVPHIQGVNQLGRYRPVVSYMYCSSKAISKMPSSILELLAETYQTDFKSSESDLVQKLSFESGSTEMNLEELEGMFKEFDILGFGPYKFTTDKDTAELFLPIEFAIGMDSQLRTEVIPFYDNLYTQANSSSKNQ